MNFNEINKNSKMLIEFIKNLLLHNNIIINIYINDKDYENCLFVLESKDGYHKEINTNIDKAYSFVLINKILEILLEEKETDEKITISKIYERKIDKEEKYGLNIFGGNSIVRMYIRKDTPDIEKSIEYFNDTINKPINTMTL